MRARQISCAQKCPTFGLRVGLMQKRTDTREESCAAVDKNFWLSTLARVDVFESALRARVSYRFCENGALSRVVLAAQEKEILTRHSYSTSLMSSGWSHLATRRRAVFRPTGTVPSHRGKLIPRMVRRLQKVADLLRMVTHFFLSPRQFKEIMNELRAFLSLHHSSLIFNLLHRPRLNRARERKRERKKRTKLR